MRKKPNLNRTKGDSMAVFKMKNGTWGVDIYIPKAPRIRKVFKTRNEARKYETITKGELAKGKVFHSKKQDPGNESFGKLLLSSACEIGTKCGATNARILSKTLKASNFVMGLD